MRKRRLRLTPLDGAVLFCLVAFAAYLGWRVTHELQYHWNWAFLPQYVLRFDERSQRWVAGLLLQGLATTVRLSLISGLLATLLGTAMGLARISLRPFWRMVGGGYVGLVRNVPPLVLILFFYFFIGDQILTALHLGEGLAHISGWPLAVLEALLGPVERILEFLSAVITLTLFEAAYITEIVRAGIQSIDEGQWEASAALGFNRRQQLFAVILPQAFQRMLPPLAGQFISTIKDSSIVSVIAIQELTFQGQELMASTYHTFEIWIVIVSMYFLLTFSCSLAVRRLERRLAAASGSMT